MSFFGMKGLLLRLETHKIGFLEKKYLKNVVSKP